MKVFVEKQMKTELKSFEYYYQRWESTATQRYYLCYIARDLLNDWVLTLAYGGLNSKLGSVTHQYCSSIGEALKKIEVIAKKRQRRGYALILQKSSP